MDTVSPASPGGPFSERDASLSRSAALWMGKGFWAILDQGAIAASNFLVALFLARQLIPADYGAYALAFEIFLLLSVFYASFILEPMSVFGSSMYRDCLGEYLGIILRIHLWVALGTVVVLGAAAWLVHTFMRSDSLGMALAGVTVAGPCLLLFWVARRAFYVNLAPRAAACGATAYSLTVLSGLFLFYRMKLLSPFVAFLLMSAGALVTAPILLIRLKPSFARTTEPRMRGVLFRHWNYGRWAIASSVATWGTGAIFYFALTSFHGLSAAGEMKALLNLSSPVGQGFAAFSLLSLPYASRIHHQEGPSGLKRLAWHLTYIYAGGTIAYFVVIIFIRGFLLHLLYADKYMQVISLIPWVGLGMVLRIAATAQAILLRALQSPRQVFIAYGASGAVAAVIGIPLCWAFGLTGAVWAGVLSSATALVVSFILLKRSLSDIAEVGPCLHATA